MKKSLLKLSTLFLAIGLVACGGPTSSGSEGGNSTPAGGDINLEVAEDKTAYVMKLSESSIELSSFNSIFLTGDMAVVDENGTWAKGLQAIEMKSGILDGYLVGYSDKYEPAEDATQANQYQLVVGYNSTAETADSRKGLVWNDAYKSDECLSFGGDSGLGNPTFTYDAAKRIADLGTHTFSNQPKAPEPALENFTIRATFAESVPEYAVPHIMGSFDGWSTTTYSADAEAASRMTVVADSDRKVWTLTVAEIYADNYDWTMSLDYTLEAKAGQTNYSWKKPAELASGNLQFTVAQIMGNNASLDLTAEPLTFDFAKELPDPTKTANLKIVATTEGEAVKDGVEVCVTGDFTSWGAVAMTASADRKTFTLELEGVTAGNLNFGITLNGSWNHCVKAVDGTSNISGVLVAGEDLCITVVADLAAAFNADDATQVEQAATSVTPSAWTK